MAENIEELNIPHNWSDRELIETLIHESNISRNPKTRQIVQEIKNELLHRLRYPEQYTTAQNNYHQ